MSDWDVTVLIPTLPERPELLANALNSVNAQTLPAAAVIVEEAQDDDDAAVTRNRALEKVTTPWVAFLDDDDELEPSHLETLVEGAKTSGADVVFSWFKILKQDGTLALRDDALWTQINGQRRSGFGIVGNDAIRAGLRVNCFVHLCCLVRTSVAQAARFPRPGTSEWAEPHSEDWGFWFRVMKTDATFHHVPERTWHWRDWDGRTNGQPIRRTKKRTFA